jgi:HSP20 family protein
MTKKMFWEKITGLSTNILSQTTEKVEVLSLEKRVKKQKKKIEVEEKEWPLQETGQLTIDLYETDDSLVIESPVAGVKPEDFEIIVESDLITIRGERKKTEKKDLKRYFYQECFWGKFSRTLVLPHPVKSEEVKATLKNGILTIILPKEKEKRKSVTVE